MSMSKKKKGWIIFIAIFVGLIVGIAAYFIITHQIEINKKLATPTNLQVHTVSTGQVIVIVDECEKAQKYEFTITENGSSFPSTVISTVNSYDITAICNNPNTYTVTCRYLGQTNKAHSDVSETCTVTTQRKLKTPEIYKIEDKKLYFKFNENLPSTVEYTFQMIYQTTLDGTPSYLTEYTPITQDNNGAITGYFDLSELVEVEYRIAVKAITTTEFYISSDVSAQVLYNNAPSE